MWTQRIGLAHDSLTLNNRFISGGIRRMTRAILAMMLLALSYANVGCCQRWNCRGGCGGGCTGTYCGDWYEGGACCETNTLGSCCNQCCSDPCDPCCRPVRNWWRRLFADIDRGRCCNSGCCNTGWCDSGCSSCNSCGGGGCQSCQSGHMSSGEVIQQAPTQPRQLNNGGGAPVERVAPPPVPPMQTRGPAELNSRAVRTSPAPTPARRR